jgi:hypothetical protein
MIDLKTCSERKKYVIDIFGDTALTLYSPDGKFNKPEHGLYAFPYERDKMRVAMILLEYGGEVARKTSEALILQSFMKDNNDLTLLSLEDNFDKDANPGYQCSDWNIFISNYASKILAKHTEILSEAVVEKLKRITFRNFSRFAGSAEADYLPHGYNDNMPAEAMAGLILGGEALGNQDAINDGLLRLEMFAEMLSRRGSISEHSSGTYTPLTIAAVSDIAEYSKSPKIRELALKVEAHLWTEITLFYHINSGKHAGPASRSYLVNSLGHIDGRMIAFWVASGYPKHFNPSNFILDLKENQVVHFKGDPWGAFGDIITGLSSFHFPEYLLKDLEERKYPRSVRCTTEYGGEDGGCSIATVWQMPEYSLASSTSSFGSGDHSESLYIAYCRKNVPVDFGDAGVIYSRYLYNDEAPGIYTGIKGKETGLLRNRGLTRVLQKDGTALLVSQAYNSSIKQNLLQGRDISCKKISKLRQAIIVPLHFFDIQECFIGNKKITEFPSYSTTAKPVFLNLGRAYLAFNPFVLTEMKRNKLIYIERFNRYLTISFINYEGPERNFSEQELKEIFNGFSVDISGPDFNNSFSEFRKKWRSGRLEDLWFSGCRHTRLKRPNLDLIINWITENNRIRSMVIDGQVIDMESPLKASDFNEYNLPFIGKPYHPMNHFIPNDSLNIPWYPHLKWQRDIGNYYTN